MLNNCPHPREVRQFFYNDQKKAARVFGWFPFILKLFLPGGLLFGENYTRLHTRPPRRKPRTDTADARPSRVRASH